MTEITADVSRRRAISLFTFLKELYQLRSKSIRSWEQYEQVVWFDDVPQELGCHCIAWAGVDAREHPDAWVEIRKPRLKSAPKLPIQLVPWVSQGEIANFRLEAPSLHPQVVTEETQRGKNGEEETVADVQLLADHPEVSDSWAEYLTNSWVPWADDARKLQHVQDTYTNLFTMYQRQQKLGEAFEVVVGLGYLTWATTGAEAVKRHLITLRASIQFDADRGVVTVGPAGEGARPTVEQDMLDPSQRPEAHEQRAIEQQVAEIGDDVWDRTRVQAALRSWVHAASAQGTFEDTLFRQHEIPNAPEVHLAPAVILRRRTDQSFIRIFGEIIRQLENGADVPLGVHRIVEIVDDRPSTSPENGEPSSGSPEDGEIYFPLPANESQLEIARKMRQRQGVLVQGPPGTGKSHTIANLVCHLLANGQRVLITSHTARALRALLERFRSEVSLKEIADLCVILLGDDLESFETLAESVRGITRRFKEWEPGTSSHNIQRLEGVLDRARRAEASALTRLRGIRESDTHSQVLGFGNYRGTGQLIAIQVREEESKFGWLANQKVADGEPPISNGQAVELLSLIRSISPQRVVELELTTPEATQILSAPEFVNLVLEERRAIETDRVMEGCRAYPEYEALTGVSRELRRSVAALVTEFRAAVEGWLSRSEPWLSEVVQQVLSDRARPWAELASETRRQLSFVAEKARRASGRRIAGLKGRDRTVLREHSWALLKHFELGGGAGFGPFRARAAREGRYLITSVAVDGQKCNKPLPLRHLIEWLDAGDGLARLSALWSRITPQPQGSLAEQIAAYEDLEGRLRGVFELEKKRDSAKQQLAAVPSLPEPTWHDVAELRRLEDAIRAADCHETLTSVQTRFLDLERILKVSSADPACHPTVHRLVEAVRQRNERAYGTAWSDLNNVWRDRLALEQRDRMLATLQVSASDLAENLFRTASDPSWDRRLREFEGAWNWFRADKWLRTSADPVETQRLSQEAARYGRQTREILRDLAAAKAWNHCFAQARFTEEVRQHLEAWTKAMARVGRGTGKYAAMHRQAAREHMEHCRSAIPAWIMPLYRVAETVRPGTDLFDVVIVDEASQSGPEALFLHYLAKKMVVVGDDKQISPDFIGLDRSEVDLLRQRHLTEIPHNDALGVDNSFFDQAEIRFGGRIRLREHFRCMPEIIQFSNDLCYRGEPLLPLRQFGVGRLVPTRVRFIAEGYEKGSAPRTINPPEAEAIVGQIRDCIKDPAYAEKTMGVISLLGEGQAREIEKRLIEVVGPEEMERRQIVCGDAYAFQGTERDVMFLSMVVAPREGRRIGTLSSTRDERRFNVAASRARDQVWLFHTVTLNDLSPLCLRHRLLQYYLNPQVDRETIEGLNISEIEASAARRNHGSPPEPFDSWFEVDVFLQLAKRGFRVLPQYKLAGYSIDLLVQGMRGRLAVECDGDAWHGADRYLQDDARQRMLERCGLQFWRVRGTVYYRNNSEALEGLWEALEKLDIHPSGYMRPVQGKDTSAEVAALGPADQPQEGDAPSGQTGGVQLKGPAVGVDQADDGEGLSDPTEAEDENPEADTSRAWIEVPGVRLYSSWRAHPVPDPRSASTDQLIRGLVAIVEAEGPMFCFRAYRTYVKAAGLQRVGREIRSVLNRAMAAAVRQGLLDERNELDSRDQLNQIVRKAGTPEVVLRSRGPRSFHEIPPSEVAALVKSLRVADPNLSGEALLQAVMRSCGIGRTTSQIRDRFGFVISRHQDS